MATIIEARMPAEEFALAETLQTCAEATVECEQLVDHPAKTVMPLVWVRNTSPDVFEAALDQDATVAAYTQLASTETEWLYEMDWRENVQLVLQFFTRKGAVILDTVGSASGWDLRVLFPDHDDVRATTDVCDSHNLTLTIQRIRQLDDETARQGRSARFGLTTDQHEALTAAYNQGYFRVPREVDLDDLAAEMDISHQALSERLRRAHQTLIEEMLGVGSASPQQSATDDDRSDDSSGPPGAN